MNIPADIITSCTENNLVPMVGAGVSMSIRKMNGDSAFPGWLELLRRGKEELDRQGEVKVANLVAAFMEMGLYQEAASRIKDGLVGALWDDFIKKNFTIKPSEIDMASLELARSIWRLGRKIITLNYDKVLELASPEPFSIASIDNTQSAELPAFLKSTSDAQKIWHLHGNVDNIASIILNTESYDNLYDASPNFQAAIATLQSVLQIRSLLFVGCSMEDVELLEKINHVNDMFNGNTRPHYALIKAGSSSELSAKLKRLQIRIIEFSDFGQPLLDILRGISEFRVEPSNLSIVDSSELIEPVDGVIKKIAEVSKLAVLSYNPLGRRKNYSGLRAEIEKLKCEKYFYPLSFDSLQNLDDFDAVLIVTEWVKDKLMLEGDALSPKRISLTDLSENISASMSCCVFLFAECGDVNSRIKGELEKIAFPTALVTKLNNTNLQSLFFQVFKKNKLDHEGIYSNPRSFCFPNTGGVAKNIEVLTRLPTGIDMSSIRDFVGRSTDIRNVLRMIISARRDDVLVTLKGSGGNGKTALAKLCAIELAQRGFFSDGIHFVDCEFIDGVQTFVKQVAQCFDLQYESDFLSALRLRPASNQFMILDNVETLLYLETSPAICEVISQMAELVTILCTSRDSLDLLNESIYELRRLTSEEASELFVNQLKGRKLTDSEKKFIKERIVEDLLDNSPLAIKLITRTIPKGKDLLALEQELRDDVFRHHEGEDLFRAEADTNVERKKSIYASINYSYQRLNEKEKKVFELLSLFPDGVNIENFKQLSKNEGGFKPATSLQSSGFMITDPLLKSLESKSMVQSNNGLVRLQSLLGRFADDRLKRRDPSELRQIQKNSFNFMYAFADLLSDMQGVKSDSARVYYDSSQKNFLRAILTAKQLNISPSEVAQYLTFLMLVTISGLQALRDAIAKANFDFVDYPTENLSIKIVDISASYYLGNFDEAIKELQLLMPRPDYFDLPHATYLERYTKVNAASIYGMEGAILDELMIDIVKQNVTSSYPSLLYRLGVIDPDLVAQSDAEFFTFEAKLMLGRLTIEEIDSFIKSRPKKHYLETLQINYTRTKLAGKPLTPIESLIPVNPYSAGMKHLMLAMTSLNHSEANIHYREAIGLLEHIKFYFVEAHLQFARFLKSHSDSDFTEIFDIGLHLASLYHFRYLQYCFEELLVPTGIIYDVTHYPLPTDRDYEGAIGGLVRRGKSSRNS